MQRIALGIRYDGTGYHGWQSQGRLTTVQRTVENALSAVADQEINVTCAGRTDAGVHATAQVVHFETEAKRSDYAWVFGANSNLPNSISVTWAKFVDPTFHARFSATARRYRYVVFNHSVRPGILRHAVGWFHRPLDEHRMQEAAQHLLGEHDFNAFRGAGCQAKNAVRTIHELTIQRQRRMIIIEVYANAFLLHMVRNIAGSLLEVGAGRHPSEWMRKVLLSRDRRQAAMTISPSGLYLVDVDYPESFDLPKNPVGPFFLP